MMNIIKDKMQCERENRLADQFNAGSVQFTPRLNWLRRCPQKRLEVDNFMKIRIVLGLFIVLGASCASVRAADNPAQAAARVILEQKLSQPDAWEPQPLTPAATAPSVAAARQPVKAATNVTGTVFEKAVTPQTAQAPTTPVAAPAAAPAAVASVVASPDMLLLMMSLLIISFLTMSFLLLKLLRQNSRNYGAGSEQR